MIYRDEEISFNESTERFEWVDKSGKLHAHTDLSKLKKLVDRVKNFRQVKVWMLRGSFRKSLDYDEVTVTSRSASGDVWIVDDKGRREKISYYSADKLYAITPENEELLDRFVALEDVITKFRKEQEEIKAKLIAVDLKEAEND